MALVSTAFLQTPSELEVRRNHVDVAFPEAITFHLQLAPGKTGRSVGLRYGTDGRTCQQAGAYQPVQAGGDGDRFSWTWDLARYGTLPVGTEIWWQWELVDDEGNQFVTARQSTVVLDEKFSFKEAGNDDVTLYWLEGDESFGPFLLALTRQKLAQLEGDFGVAVPRPVRVVVYPSVEDARAALVHVPEWTGAAAFVRYSTIVAGIAAGDRAWAEQVLPHEIGHLVVGAAIFNCLGNRLPTWLSEGLAVYAEGPLASWERQMVEKALVDESLPRLSYYAQGFSAFGGDAALAYAQSALVVRYLIETHGVQQMGHLLSEIREGLDIDDALQAVYGLNTDGLDATWRQSLGYDALPTRVAPSTTPTMVPTLAPLTLQLPPTDTPAPTSNAAATVTKTATAIPSPTPSRETLIAAADSETRRAPEVDERSQPALTSQQSVSVSDLSWPAVISVLGSSILLIALLYIVYRRWTGGRGA